MKGIINQLIPLLAMTIFVVGCSSNNESPTIDCSLSDLSVSVVSRVNSDCADGGSITVQASGGTPGYFYSANGIDFQSSEILSNLFAGNYTITVRDLNGCTAQTTTVLEGESGSVSLSLDFTDSDCGSSTGTITANASGGTAPYLFSLNEGAPQSSNVFNGVSNGLNIVSVTDAINCEVERTISVGSGISLERDIMPIILSNCAVTGCHNGSRSPDLRTSALVINSSIRIKERTSARTMPPSDRGNLSQIDIDRIACWVDDGAPDN